MAKSTLGLNKLIKNQDGKLIKVKNLNKNQTEKRLRLTRKFRDDLSIA